MLKVFFDGLCEPENPGGVACYAFVVHALSSKGEDKVFEDCGLVAEPSADSNHDAAEYTALIKSLEWIRNNSSDRRLEISGDSRLVIGQLGGKKVRPVLVIPLHDRARSLLEGLEWTARWIPRDENNVADELCLKAYREYCMRTYGMVPPTMRQSGAIR